MVSLYVPGSYPVARIRAKLDLELSTAVNIKDAVNRASVQQALRSCLGYTLSLHSDLTLLKDGLPCTSSFPRMAWPFSAEPLRMNAANAKH